MVYMASGIDRECVRPTTKTTEQHGGHTLANRSTKACILGLQRCRILNIHVMVN